MTLAALKYADVADAKAVVPRFKSALREAKQRLAAKCAESDRLVQPFAEKNVVKGPLDGRFKGRIKEGKRCKNSVYAEMCPKFLPRCT